MAVPAYLWLKDNSGAAIKGAVEVLGREVSIEVLSFGHNLRIPVDGNTGKLTSTRIHSPMFIEKEFERSSPFLYKFVATGCTLQSAEIKWYQINRAGHETEYFNMLLENVKIVSISPGMHNCKDPALHHQNHIETIEFRYEKITWKHCDGNIIFSDSWNE
ncbi:Hcp family type VI secretion system effector [Brenneria goodwinii]|uniref:Hcp family type VI secretion system effector n=1 Tax=Brenneria goodwinii TaxID=1109412 RepID=UPI0036E691FF